MTIFEGDVEFYRKSGEKLRGRRYEAFAAQLDARALALYWRDLATDLNAVVCNGERPRWLTNTFCGKVLDIIYDRARQEVPEGVFPPETLRGVQARLVRDERMHLRMITTVVPIDYRPRSRVVD